MPDTSSQPRRFPFLDELRGVAIVMMVAYHFLYDLVTFGGLSFPLYSTPAVIWQNCIGALFITLSGCVSLFSRSNVRRGVKCLMGSAAVFAVTYFTAPYPAWFGVLCLLGCCMMLFPLLRPIISRIPSALGAAVCIGLFFVCYPVPSGKLWLPGGAVSMPAALYRSHLTALAGFPPAGFASSDYYPLLPWLLLFVAGAFLGKLLKSASLSPGWNKSRVPALAYLGRHSFAIYLLHQPVLFAITWLLTKIF